MILLNLNEKKKLIDKFAEGFNKTKKQVVVGRIGANEELKEKLKLKFIPTPSLRVNRALGGGWARGRITTLTGEADSGKTFILLETIAKAMKEDPDFMVGWLESESSVSIKDFELFDIDIDRVVFSEARKDGGAEEAIDIVEAMLTTGALDMFVINSVKCLVPKKELDGSMEDQTIGLQARFNAKMMRKLTSLIKETNTAFIMVQHLSTEIGKERN